jgi:hypothetical protein
MNLSAARRSAKPPVPPIFVADADDITVFASIEDAEKHLEAADVNDGIYEGWDAQGRVLSIEADAVTRFNAPPVRIQLAEPLREEAGDLRDRLAAVLDRHADTDVERHSLDEVVHAYVEWAGYA